MQQLIYILDLFGVAVFAISGSLAAGRKRMDIFGVAVLATVTALGGGSLRDMILDHGPVFWVTDNTYLFVTAGAAIGTFFVVRIWTIPNRWLLLCDAIGLAVFTVIGTEKALSATTSGACAVVMGIMTGVAGGVIRDVLSAEIPLIFRREIYATACLCGAVTYVAACRVQLPIPACVTIAFLLTLMVRLAAIKWSLSLPVFPSR